MTTENIQLAFFIVLGIHVLTDLALDLLNMREVTANSNEIPSEFKTHIGEEEYKKSQAYTLSKSRLSIFSTLYSTAILLTLILSSALGHFDQYLNQYSLPTRFGHGIAFLIGLTIFSSLTSIPLSLYSTFVLEERFGFNKTTFTLWLRDLLLSFCLSIVLLTPIIYGVLWIMEYLGSAWWVYAFVFLTLIQLLLMYLFPVLIAPLFNKFSPLPEGPLLEAIRALATKLEFANSGIFVMDGSKRSSHGNAYFTGFGSNKRIVLFDTLVDQLSIPQATAVLAHEIGHQKKNHIKKSMALSIIFSAFSFYVLSLLTSWEAFFQAFGLTHVSNYAALGIFSIASSPIAYFISPLFSILSRRFEYQADHYAVEAVGSSSALCDALISLSKKSLSNLTPHPLYSFFHYSHPTLRERIQAMRLISE